MIGVDAKICCVFDLSRVNLGFWGKLDFVLFKGRLDLYDIRGVRGGLGSIGDSCWIVFYSINEGDGIVSTKHALII